MKTKIDKKVNISIDWDKVQLLWWINNEGKELIIFTNGKHTSEHFSGTVVHQSETNRPLGEFGKDWSKSLFQVYEGTLTLNN